jgi:hypothetical protein
MWRVLRDLWRRLFGPSRVAREGQDLVPRAVGQLAEAVAGHDGPKLGARLAPVLRHAGPIECQTKGWLNGASEPQLQMLVDACAALASEVSDFLVHACAPLASGVPVDAMTVGNRGLAWAVMAHALDVDGAESFMSSFAPKGGLQPLGCRDEAGPADLIILHVIVERLVARFDVAHLSTPRRPDGLRRLSFLRGYPRMVQEDRTLARAVSALVRESPLTQLVYWDLLLTDSTDAARVASGIEVLCPAVRQDADGAIWLGRLASSVLGAWLSPPSSYEALERAHLEEAEFAGAQGRRGRKLKLEAQRRREASEQSQARQWIERPLIANTLLQNTALRVRVLESWVHSILARTMSKIPERWRELKNSLPRAREVMGADGPCGLQAFADLLHESSPSRIPDGNREAVYRSLQALLLARDEEGTVSGPWSRLRDPAWGVRLPLPPPLDEPVPIARLLEEWCVDWGEVLRPARTATTVTTTVTSSEEPTTEEPAAA